MGGSTSGPRAALAAIYTLPTRTAALDAAARFATDFAEWPRATAKVADELDVRLAFHDIPAEHHVHLRTTNPISESSFSTVRLRTKGGHHRETHRRGRPGLRRRLTRPRFHTP